MDLTAITVDNFKAHFRRDFPYLPSYSASELYNIGDRVYYPASKLFYECKSNGITDVAPTVSASWTALSGISTDDYILDEDIEKAFLEAQANFNQSLLGSEAIIRMAYYYMTAHYLVNDIRAALGGISGKSSFLVSSKSAGSVSESYAIPEKFTSNPIVSFFAQTPYGIKYLSFVLPRLVGNIGAVTGATSP